MYALPFFDKSIRIGGQLDFSQIEKDNVQIISNFNINDPKGGNRIVPYPLVESNGDVLNTGGTFMYIGPTLEIAPVPGFLLSANFSISLFATQTVTLPGQIRWVSQHHLGKRLQKVFSKFQRRILLAKANRAQKS